MFAETRGFNILFNLKLADFILRNVRSNAEVFKIKILLKCIFNKLYLYRFIKSFIWLVLRLNTLRKQEVSTSCFF